MLNNFEGAGALGFSLLLMEQAGRDYYESLPPELQQVVNEHEWEIQSLADMQAIAEEYRLRH